MIDSLLRWLGDEAGRIIGRCLIGVVVFVIALFLLVPWVPFGATGNLITVLVVGLLVWFAVVRPGAYHRRFVWTEAQRADDRERTAFSRAREGQARLRGQQARVDRRGLDWAEPELVEGARTRASADRAEDNLRREEALVEARETSRRAVAESVRLRYEVDKFAAAVQQEKARARTAARRALAEAEAAELAVAKLTAERDEARALANTATQRAGLAVAKLTAERDEARAHANTATERADLAVAKLTAERDEARAHANTATQRADLAVAKLTAERDEARAHANTATQRADLAVAKLTAERDEARARAATAEERAAGELARLEAELGRLEAHRDQAVALLSETKKLGIPGLEAKVRELELQQRIAKLGPKAKPQPTRSAGPSPTP